MSIGRFLCSAMLALVLFVPALVEDAWASGQTGAGGGAVSKVSRWESNLSVGVVLEEQFGIVKSFWWYPLPKVFAVGLSFDFIGATLPLSVNVSLNLPTPVVIPFVCAGVGMSISRGWITNLGGGIKFRLWKKIGLIAEYRKYTHDPDPYLDPPDAPKRKPDYLGIGISYLY